MFGVLGGFLRGGGSQVVGVRTLFPRGLHRALAGAARDMSRSDLATSWLSPGCLLTLSLYVQSAVRSLARPVIALVPVPRLAVALTPWLETRPRDLQDQLRLLELPEDLEQLEVLEVEPV